jgi:hypothetical protein
MLVVGIQESWVGLKLLANAIVSRYKCAVGYGTDIPRRTATRRRGGQKAIFLDFDCCGAAGWNQATMEREDSRLASPEFGENGSSSCSLRRINELMSYVANSKPWPCVMASVGHASTQ